MPDDSGALLANLTSLSGGGQDLTQFALGQQQPTQTTQQSSNQTYPTIASDQTAPQPAGTAIPKSETTGQQDVEQRPLSFGMYVATPDFVQKFDNYLQNGGDINKIPVRDQLGVAMAKDPDFFKKNPDAFYDYVYKPLEAQKKLESPGTIFNQAIKNIPGWLTNTFNSLLDATYNTVELSKDQAQLAYRKATGMTSGQAYQDLVTRLANENATANEGTARAVTTNERLMTDIGSNMVQGTKPIAKFFANSPESQDQIDRSYSQLLLNKATVQQTLEDFGKTVQNTSANAYQITGKLADLGEKMKTASVNQSAAAGYETALNPTNYLGIGEGAAVVGAARPILFERVLQAGEDLTGATAKKSALDVTQILPKNPELDTADPAYIATRNMQAKLAPDARSAAQDVADAQNVLNSRLTTLNKISGDPGTVTEFASNALQTGGNIAQGAAGIAKSIQPENIAHWITKGDPFWKPLVQTALEKTVFGGLLEKFGPVGGAIEAGLEKAPDLLNAAGSLAKTMGQELMYADSTIPFATRVAQQNKLMPKGLASFLDLPAIQTAAAVGKAGLSGVATGAAIGGAAGGIPGAVAGAVQGGILSTAGGGFGQWMRYQNPNQYLLAARSDWKRYSDYLSPVERQNFSQLSPTNQVIIAQNAMKFNGLRLDYFNDPNGPRGMHYVDPGGASHIQINVANPQSALRGIFAHELTHAATHSGMVTELYDTHLGNPVTGEIGQFTALGADGKPVGIDPVTQRYFPNQEFQNLKNQYVNALAQSGVPTAHLNDFDISREIYAEHGVDYLLSGGAILDSNSAFRPGLYSKAALKNAMAQVGYTFDDSGRMIGAPNGTISGTGLFTDLQRNRDLMNLAQAYHTKEWQDGLMSSEEQPTRQFTKKDLQNPNSTETWLNNASEIRRNQDGTAQRDPLTGQPIMRSPKEVKEYNANFADSLRRGLESLPEDQRTDLGYRRTVDEQGRTNISLRYLPDNLLDSLAATNQYNPHQIASLRMLSRVLADNGNPGMEMRFFYRTATTPSKRYGTFAGSERLAVPYGFEITHDNNVNIKSVDFNQLGNNYLKVRNRDPYKSLWKDANEFTQDAHTYFTNHKEGRPGADAIGEQKRDAINSLAGFGTQIHAGSNPLVDQMPQSVRPIIKSFAIDRANQISATGAVRPFISEAQYYKMNRNYLPGAAEVSYLPRPAATDDLRASPELRTNSPERQAEINDVQQKAGKWMASAGKAPDISTGAYLEGDRKFPEGKMNNQSLGEFIKANHDQIDLSKPEVRERMAQAMTYDAMDALHKDPRAYGWYGDTVDKSIDEVAKLDPRIKDDPLHNMMFKAALAVTSQGQKVHPNFESAYKAYQHFADTGELPTDTSVFGGGIKAKQMAENFQKINDLHKELGTDGLQKFLSTDISVRDLKNKYGFNVGNEAADSEFPGSVGLGPKIGAFFANLNKQFHLVTMDLWLARTIKRMTGNLFDFSESAFRDNIVDLRDRLNNDEVPGVNDVQRDRMLRQIDTLEKVKDGSLTRERAMRGGKAIMDWASQTHDDFQKQGVDEKTGKTRSYPNGTPVKRLGKTIDESVNKITSDPGNATERGHIRDVFSRVQSNMADAGINISNADLQALLWYREQALFKKAGALQKGSENFDYLDAANWLRRKYQR